MAVALAAVDVMAAPDVTDVVGADLTVVADTDAVTMTKINYTRKIKHAVMLADTLSQKYQLRKIVVILSIRVN